MPSFIHSWDRISNMGGLSPELKLRLGDLLIRPVASFGCQIWGVNFLIIIIIIIKGHSLLLNALMLLYADDLVLLAPDSRSLEAAL